MPWYKCTVNEVGPASDATDTPDLVVYINLTDTEGSFANTWFYAANGIQNQALDVGYRRDKRSQIRRGGRYRTSSGKQPIYENQSHLRIAAPAAERAH